MHATLLPPKSQNPNPNGPSTQTVRFLVPEHLSVDSIRELKKPYYAGTWSLPENSKPQHCTVGRRPLGVYWGYNRGCSTAKKFKAPTTVLKALNLAAGTSQPLTPKDLHRQLFVCVRLLRGKPRTPRRV